MGGDAEQCGAMASQDDNGSWKAGSIAERRAARCGFSLTPRLNTVRFRGVSPVSSPAARSPYLLTIPPGLSPAALLDSPVLLSNSQSQASPSIGKIRWLHVDQEIAASDDVAPPISCVQSDESQSQVHSSVLADNLISADGKNEFLDIVNQEIEFGCQVCPPIDGVTVEPPVLNGDQTELCPSAGKRADEYNWRKYGQKHVKGSSTNKDEEPILNSKQGSEYKNGAEWNIDGPSSSSIVTELSESLSTAQEKHPDLLTLKGKQEIASTLTKQIDEEDVATQGTRSIEDDSEDPEIESKRMKKGAFLIETSSTSLSVREQKVVVQAISEVDILDDGYRWRKYGQKVVKGNPNPSIPICS
ncbi:hypothetical protein J5N97_007342 [Dioscorea zingiberensis]|uniref:WRKY domain-containing protein n=1 Tax=Dioscorea zingiberensis TaxID=325984 RepID=A0A9D5DBK8_9LILI|nr:hypothetical protein J5N97_007342 [Dioscorea zingiberensis]